MFDIERSTVLSPEQWSAVQEHLLRIDRARATRDWAQGVGSAKELVESIARIALEVRGVGVSNAVRFPALIHEAHGVLERPDAEELASDLPTKTIVKQAKAAVTQLAELRKAVGTGHGSATRRATIEEHADVSMDAAVLWCNGLSDDSPQWLTAVTPTSSATFEAADRSRPVTWHGDCRR